MGEFEKLKEDYRLSPLAAELVMLVLSLPPEHQRDLAAELKSRKNSARRRFLRQPHAESVQFSAGGKIFAGNMKNVSQGGAFVEILESDLKRLGRGQAVTLSFAHPNSTRNVKFTGEIARTSPDGVGIRFNAMM